MAHIFISYAHANKLAVDRLTSLLRDKGRTIWIDQRDIHPASKFMEVIVPAIHACEAFVFVFSSDSAVSKYCLEELAYAFESRSKLIPLWLESPKRVGNLPEQIHGITGIAWDEEKLEDTIQHLLQAIDTDADWERTRKRLLTAAKQWEERAQPTDLLLRGKQISEAFDIVARAQSQNVELTSVELDYVQESQRQEAAELLHERELKQRAIARQLEAEAELLLQREPAALELAVHLAIESIHRSPSLEATHILREGLALLPMPVAHARHDKAIRDVCISGCGEYFATASGDGIARVWDAATGGEICSINHGRTVLRVAFRGDDSVVSIGGDGTLRISALPEGSEVRRISVDPATAVLTSNGLHAASGEHHTGYVWNLSEEDSRRQLQHEDRVSLISVNPQGDQAATLSSGPVLVSQRHSLRLWNLHEGSFVELSNDLKTTEFSLL